MRRQHLEPLLKRNSLRLAIDDERRNPCSFVIAVDAGEYNIEIGQAGVRGPGLSSIENVVVAVAIRRGRDRAGVRASLGLRQRKRRQQTARPVSSQVAVPLA